MSDPLVDEVRATRHAISAAAGHDPKRLFKHIKAYERKLKRTGKYRFVTVARETHVARG
jgi:hypothetical protein